MRKRRFTKQIGLPVEQETYEEIVTLCNEQELSISQWIRDAIEMKLSQLHENQNQQTTSGNRREKQNG